MADSPPIGGCGVDRDRDTVADGSRGYVHSHEATSGVDGPGLRYVVWLMGCHFRCQYCHNPDTWPVGSGQLLAAEAVLDAIANYRAFLTAAGGGVTISGGEPLVQAAFAMNLLRGSKRLGLHTALDTNGYLGHKLRDEDLLDIDLVLLDLKAFGAEQHRRVTGMDNHAVLEFAERLADLGRPAWVRFVVVPGLTDEPDDVRRLARFVSGLKNVERVEAMPFHQLGESKWRRIGVPYPLEGVPPANEDEVEAVRAQFRESGCPVT